MSSPTNQEIEAAAAILAKFQPGFLPFPIFHEIARLTVTSTVELVPLRRHNGQIQVLLTQRPADDLDWPGLWHVPGTVLRATDAGHGYATAFERIIHDELPGAKLVGEPHYLQILFHKVARGVENDAVHYVEIAGEPKAGRFFNVDELPKNIADHHPGFIQAAAQAFAGDLWQSELKSHPGAQNLALQKQKYLTTDKA